MRKTSLSLRRHAGNTSVVSKSSSDWLNYTGFPGDVCVAFFNIPPGTPQREFLRNLLLWRHFHAPKLDAEKRTVIGCLTY